MNEPAALRIARRAAAPPLQEAPGHEPRLLLASVTKRWPGVDEPVLDSIDLALPPATLAGLVGRNGAGKTTLLRIVAGIIIPDAGVVRLDGLSPTEERRAYMGKIGFLAAGSVGLYARLSVSRHLEYAARIALVPSAERAPSIDAAIDRFELRELARRRADRLSMGQRQRLRLAMAFLHRPSLALLDEPWNSLDSEGMELLNDVLAAFTAAGGTALFCVPTGAELDRLPVDSVFMLEGGRLERA